MIEKLIVFFFGADLLSADSWDKGNLGSEKEFDIQIETFKVALDIALSI